MAADVCSFVGEKGACGQTVGLMVGAGGKPLCAWHDPARVHDRRDRAAGAEPNQPSSFPTVDDLPVREVGSLEDAEKMARWATVAVATGKLDPRRAQAIVALVREYRMVAADAGVMQKAAALVAQAEKDAAEFANLRRRVAVAKEKGLDV